jgi:hypothetical protein
MIFTTSWDDGYTMDLELAALLKKYGCTGTFYVCPAVQHEQAMLSDHDLRLLDRDGFEIGSHTIGHPRLTTVSDEIARRELHESKSRLENILGHECAMFCYPKGAENAHIRKLVREAGYRGARTVEQLQFDVGIDPFGLPTTLHVYPFPWRQKYSRWWHFLDPFGPLRVKNARLRELQAPMRAKRSWLQLAKFLFTHAVERQWPVFHLWGHSEEVRRLGLWEDLNTFLTFVASHPGLEHRTNGALVADAFPAGR